MENVKKKLMNINPKARTNYAKHNYEDEIRKYFNNSTYSLSLLVRCLIEDWDLPVSYCGREPKYEKALLKKTCTSYSLKDPNSCKICHEEFFKEKNMLTKAGCISKYGVENPMHDETIKEKYRNSVKKKYNAHSPLANSEVQKKIQSSRNKQKIEERIKMITNSIQGKYILLDEIKTGDYLDYHNFHCLTCDCDFQFKLSNNYNSIRCVLCEPKINTNETEICQFLDELGIVYEKNVRILDGKEIDIYIPSLNIGIEHNGMYWHSTEFCDENYHQNKKNIAESMGINLIFIYEDDWNERKDLVKHRLMNVLQKSKVVYARKCSIREISPKQSNDFLNKYHLQGALNSGINIGLFYENELHALMTFGKSRYTDEYEYELYRYCSKNTVIGGASKLLKYFETTYKPTSLMTYANRDWSTGNLYKKIGFTFSKYTEPGFFYYDNKRKIRYSRQSCQKHKLIKKYKFDSNLTGDKMIEELGYVKIYNSGNCIFYKIYPQNIENK